MKKNRHEDSVLSAVNIKDFSGTTDARINCSVDSQHTLFSKTFSEGSGKTFPSNMFDIDTIKDENSGMRNSLEYHGSEFSENMHRFNQNEKVKCDQFLSMQPKTTNSSNDFKSFDVSTLGSESTLFSAAMSNYSLGTISSNIFNTSTKENELLTKSEIVSDNNRAGNLSLSSVQEISFMFNQPSKIPTNSDISHSAIAPISTKTSSKQYASVKDRIQLQQKSPDHSLEVHIDDFKNEKMHHFQKKIRHLLGTKRAPNK